MRPAALRAIVRLHRWAGLALALPLATLALSGMLLLFKGALWVPGDWRATGLAPAAVDAALAHALHTDRRWLWVDVARPGRAFHTVGYAGDTEAYLPVGQTAFPPTPRSLTVEHALFRLHEQLLAGETGEAVVRIIGPLAVVLVLLGTLAWWPRRSAWRARHLREVSSARPALLRFHMAWGAAVLIVVLPLVLSGALLAHNATIRAWLGQFQPAAVPPAGIEALRFMPGDLAGAIATARRAWPDGQLTQLSRVSAGSPELKLKFRLPGERHPNGRSTLTLSLADGRAVGWYDARRGGLPAAYDDVLYALHTGRLLGPMQAWLSLLAGLAILALLSTGLIAWARTAGRGAR